MTGSQSDGKGRRTLILHPFLLALYVVLAPLAENIGPVGLQAIRAIVTVIAVVIVATLVLQLVLDRPRKGGLLASAGVLLFGTYGHVSGLLSAIWPQTVAAEVFLLALWLGLGLGWSYWVLRKLQDPDPWNLYFNVVGGILLIFPLYSIVTYTRTSPEVKARAVEYHQQLQTELGLVGAEVAWSAEGEPRDIYYLVVDGYARGDILEELYDYDNGEFLGALEARGFYIPEGARANYADTVYALASALNMTHLTRAPDALQVDGASDPDALLKDGLAVLIADNTLTSLLREAGYEIVAFDTGYSRTALAEADVRPRSPEVPPFNAEAAFELMLLDTTLGNFFLELRGEDSVALQGLFDDHRERVRFGLTRLSDFAGRPGPQFVFSHVISPHAPYVFGPNGEPRRGVDPFTLLDQPAQGEWSPHLYRDQVTYVNSLIVREIGEILEKSDPDPIIIVHADHGSRSWPDPDPSPEMRRKLLFPIFIGLHLPDGDETVEPYPGISPVNLNRLLLSRYFGAGLPMLPDESYALIADGTRRQFAPACEAIGGCAEPIH